MSYDDIKEVIDKIPTAKIDPPTSKTERRNIELVANVFIAIADQVNAIRDEMEANNDD